MTDSSENFPQVPHPGGAHTLTEDCWCDPLLEPVKKENRGIGWVVVHDDMTTEVYDPRDIAILGGDPSL